MHYIQRSILARLMSSDSLRYADIQPPDIGSNLFSYHLTALKKAGYVIRTSWGTYTLSSSGKLLVDSLSLETLRPRIQPKITIILACRDRLGRWLLMRRKVQPLLGQVGFPYGKLHLGETIQQAAERELMEKTGLIGEFQHRGDGYITIQENGSTVSQIFAHVFYCMEPTGYFKSAHKAGDVYWGDIDTDYTSDVMLQSMPDLIKAIESTTLGQRFFVELSYDILVG